MKKQNSPQLAPRRREVVGHARQGWIRAAIANPMKIPQGSVCRGLAAMRHFWRDGPLYDFTDNGSEQWPKIDLLEAETWGAGERSQQWQPTDQITRGKMGDSTCTRRPDRQGDRRFMGEVARCIVKRHPATDYPKECRSKAPHDGF